MIDYCCPVPQPVLRMKNFSGRVIIGIFTQEILGLYNNSGIGQGSFSGPRQAYTEGSFAAPPLNPPVPPQPTFFVPSWHTSAQAHPALRQAPAGAWDVTIFTIVHAMAGIDFNWHFDSITSSCGCARRILHTPRLRKGATAPPLQPSRTVASSASGMCIIHHIVYRTALVIACAAIILSIIQVFVKHKAIDDAHDIYDTTQYISICEDSPSRISAEDIFMNDLLFKRGD